MLYQTIVLQLIQDRPALCASLRKERLMLQAVRTLAIRLKESHTSWKTTLTTSMRGESTELVDSRAMELALSDLIETIPSKSQTSGNTSDVLMQSVRNSMSNA